MNGTMFSSCCDDTKLHFYNTHKCQCPSLLSNKEKRFCIFLKECKPHRGGCVCVYIYTHTHTSIIMLCCQHRYPWPSSPNRSWPLAGLQGYIPYPHIAVVCLFKLFILLLPSHMWGSIGVHHLWARPYFSSSVLHVCFVNSWRRS